MNVKKYTGFMSGVIQNRRLGRVVLFWIFLALVFSLAGLGCASPHLATKVPNTRLGFLDRMSQWESVHVSKKHKFDFLASAGKSGHRKPAGGASSSAEAADLKAGVPNGVPKGVEDEGAVYTSKDSPATVAETSSVLNGVGGLKWPLRSVAVTSDFGKRGSEFHEGVDLKAGKGTPIYAAQSGRVLYADSRIRGYGKMVVIQHMKELATVYAHISKMLVRRGQRVIQGQKIALSGQTGRARGPHLHFEVRRGLAALNPLKLIPIIKSGAHHLAVNR